jgi:hypothetical protein
VALEARRLDKLEEAIMRSTESLKTLKYALRCCQGLIINRDFRQQVSVLASACVCMSACLRLRSHNLRCLLSGPHYQQGFRQQVRGGGGVALWCLHVWQQQVKGGGGVALWCAHVWRGQG